MPLTKEGSVSKRGEMRFLITLKAALLITPSNTKFNASACLYDCYFNPPG